MCGAARFADEAARELRRRPACQSEGAEGKTNRRFAAELHLSRKTVETHFYHVFVK